MAFPNNFSTAFHSTTNRITLVLIYALLEWILIASLLANSLFSYLILCFADYFGLHPPCPLCSSLEHLFRPGKGRTVTLCRDHLEGVSSARESAGRQVAVDDLSSLSVGSDEHVPENGLTSQIVCPFEGQCDPVKHGVRDNWEKREEKEEEEEEEEEEEWGEFRMFDVRVTEAGEQVRAKEEEEGFLFPESESDGIVARASRENDKDDLETGEDPEVIVEHDKNVIATVNNIFSQQEQISSGMDQRKDKSFVTVPHDLEFYIGNDESELIPVNLKERYTVREDDLQNFGGDVILELCMPVEKQCRAVALESPVPTSFHETEAGYSQEVKMSIDALHPEMAKDNVEEDHVLEKAVMAKEDNKAPALVDDLHELGDAMAQCENSQNNPEEKEMEEVASSQDEDSDVEVSIGTEIPDHETVDEVSAPEGLATFESNHMDACTVYDLLQSEARDIDDSGCVQSESETLEFKTIVVEMCELGISHLQQMCKDRELDHEMDEDNIPDAPGLMNSFDLHSNLMLREGRIFDSEGLIEGSLVSDIIESGEEESTIEQLKEALKAERISLHDLYAELEEERNASAVAASQTMAMINRLQEEKAAMQMEAVQYQRMMEEQSEYDQEALQLLNDLVVKTEKEKEELARELEAYRQRLEEYEARDNMMTPGRNTAPRDSENSEAEDVDGDMNETTPRDAVTCLEDSLEDFEEERMRILEHIKSLEEKLVSAAKDEDGPHFEDVQTVASWPGNMNNDPNHLTDGEDVSKHRRNGILGAGKAKRLLPLFDTTTTDEEEDEHEKNEREEERLAMEEELDYVYERLDALEADGEFLRHCMGSVTKGDKGLDILREILQYLREMRNFRD